MAIDGAVASRSLVTNKVGKDMGPLQHINVIDRTRQSKNNNAKSIGLAMLRLRE
jgi:hypothetical protein